MTNCRLKKQTIGLLIAALCCPASLPLGAEPNSKSDAAAQRPSGVLANAASAAAAAASAANAAAEAAKAAAAAAAAALGALNALQGNQAPMAIPSLAPSVENGAAATATKNGKEKNGKSKPAVLDPEPVEPPPVATPADKGGKQEDIARWFSVPAERTLVGLVGKFEVPVVVDVREDSVAELWGEKASLSLADEANLNQSVAAGLGFSREVLASSARVDQAVAQSGQARAFLLPSLGVKKSTGRERSSPAAIVGNENHTRTDTSVTLRQTLLDLPGLMDWRRREVLIKSKEESHRAARGDAFLSNVNAYLNLVSSRIQSDFAGEFEGQLNELLGYVKKRADAGASSGADEGRVRARVLTAKSSRLEQEAAHAASGLDFFRLTNTAPKIVRLPEAADVGGGNLPKDLNAAIAIAMEKNPDMASLREELRASELDNKAALGRFLPRLDLEMTDTSTDNAQGNRVNQKDQRMMVVMNWNLISGGGDVQYSKERKAKQKELEYKLDDQRRKVVQSLSSQYAILKATRERLVEGYKEMDSLSKAAKSMSQRMLYGNQSLLDLLDVYDRFYQAKSRLVNMHMQELLAIAQVSRMLEGGADERVAIATGSQEVPHASTLAAAKGLPPIKEVIATGPAKAETKPKSKEEAEPAAKPSVEAKPLEPSPSPVLASELTKAAEAQSAEAKAPGEPAAKPVAEPEVAAKPAAPEEAKPEVLLPPSSPDVPPSPTVETKPKKAGKDASNKGKKPAEQLTALKPVEAPQAVPETGAKEAASDATKEAVSKETSKAPVQSSGDAPPEPVAQSAPQALAAVQPVPMAPEKSPAEVKPAAEEQPIWKRLFQADSPKAPADEKPAVKAEPTPVPQPEPVPQAPLAPAPASRPAIKTTFCPPCTYGQECPICESTPVAGDTSASPAQEKPAVVPEAPVKRVPKKPKLSLSAVTPPLPLARY